MKIGRILHRSAVVIASLLAAAGIANAALSFSTGTGFLPGFRTIDGTDLNVLVTALNNITGGGTAGPVTASTLTVSSTSAHTGAATFGSTVAITGAETVTGAITPTGGVAAAGGFSVSCRLMQTGNEPAIATTSGTNLDIVTTETYRAEVFVPATCSSTGVAVFNGTAVAGNLTAYLISSAGAQVGAVTTGSVAASGTTAYQLIPWTGGPFTILGPATYWIAVQGNNNGGDLRTHVVGAFGADKQTGTTYGTLTVAAAPTTFATGVGVLANLY